MSPRSIGRRRVLAIAAAAGGLGLAGCLPQRRSPAIWRGVALGAESSITLYDDDPARARRVIRQAVEEIERLEKVFSLYRTDSAVSRLNRDGRLPAPPLDLVRLLGEARRYGAETGGAFDVTVQPLWWLHARHFESAPAGAAGPSMREIERTLARVDYRQVETGPGEIRFARPGMAVTLNGIAQGYITDRVAELMRGEGFDDVLIDLGEIRALGGRPGGKPWRVGIADPRRDGTIRDRLTLRDSALATSAGSGSPFEPAGRHHHLFDPRLGRSRNLYASVSVAARRATTADALSTAFSSMPMAEIAEARRRLGVFSVVIQHQDGTDDRLG